MPRAKTYLIKGLLKKILQSLPTKYDHVVAAIEETKDLILLSVDELMRSLQSPEKRLNRSKENSLESAFHTNMNLSKEKDIESKGELSSRNLAPRGRGGHSNWKRGRGGKFGGNNQGNNEGKNNDPNEKNIKKKVPPSYYCKKSNHIEGFCQLKHTNFVQENKKKETENLFLACYSVHEYL